MKILTGAEITRLITSPDGRKVVAAGARHEGRTLRINAKSFALAVEVAVSTAKLTIPARPIRWPSSGEKMVTPLPRSLAISGTMTPPPRKSLR